MVFYSFRFLNIRDFFLRSYYHYRSLMSGSGQFFICPKGLHNPLSLFPRAVHLENTVHQFIFRNAKLRRESLQSVTLPDNNFKVLHRLQIFQMAFPFLLSHVYMCSSTNPSISWRSDSDCSITSVSPLVFTLSSFKMAGQIRLFTIMKG